MTMRECIETLMAREDAGIKLQLVCRFFAIKGAMPLQRALESEIDRELIVPAEKGYYITEDGIYYMDAKTPYYRIIRGA